jgi:hypothetical protein
MRLLFESTWFGSAQVFVVVQICPEEQLTLVWHRLRHRWSAAHVSGGGQSLSYVHRASAGSWHTLQ